MLFMMLLAACGTDTDPSGIIDTNTSDIVWSQCQWKLCKMNKNVTLHLILIVLTYGM